MLKNCRWFVVVLTLAASIDLAVAVPASPDPFTVRQPNGLSLQMRMRGDEWFSWQETLDGRPVVFDENSGFWMYARQSTVGQILSTGLRAGIDAPQAEPFNVRPSSTYNQLAIDRRQSAAKKTAVQTGTGFVPVILASFSDTVPLVSRTTISNLLFSTSPGAKSMATYYREVSYGQFTVAPGAGGVADWVSVPKTRAYYGANSGSKKDVKAGEFIRDAVLAAIAAGYNFAPYDQDNDGKVDVVNLVHAGAGEEAGGGTNAIWSHRWSLTAAGLTPIVTPQGLVVDDYVVQPELRGDGSSGLPITVGVFVHEHGHALGLPDLYDSDYSSGGVGDWSGMSFGANLDGGETPALFDAWCKMKLGWLTPINYTLNYQNVPFPCAATTPFAARLWKDGVAGSQYFLVENRYKTNFDSFLPSNGLLIWHVDESKTGNRAEWYPTSAGGAPANTNSGNFLLALVQADGLYQLDITNKNASLPVSARQNHGDSGDPFPGSTGNRVFGPTSSPSSWAYNTASGAGYNSWVCVSNISDAGLVMTADLYTRSPNSGPYVEWRNIAGVVPPEAGSVFTTLDTYHPVVVKALPGNTGTPLKQIQLYLNRAQDGLWWDFGSRTWGTNILSSNVNVDGVQQNGFTLAYQSNLPSGTNLLNGTYTFIVRVINTSDIVTELQLAMTAAHRPEVDLSLTDNAIVNTLTNFTAVAREESGIGIQRVEVALFYETGESDMGPGARWYWDGNQWTTTPMWLGADFKGHPAQATLYYPIGPDAASLLSDHEYFVVARVIDALGAAATNQVSLFYDTGTPPTHYWRYSSSGNWFDPANWSPYGVPGPSDLAAINAPGDYTVTINGNANVANLRLGRASGLNQQRLVLASGELVLNGAETNKFLNTAAFEQSGNLNIRTLRAYANSRWTWSSGSLNGGVEISPNARLNLEGTASKVLGGGVLRNQGSVQWRGTGDIVAVGAYRIENLSYFEVQNDQRFQDAHYYDYTSPVFYNAGLFRKTSGTNATVFLEDNQGFVLTNAGYLQIDAGSLSLRSSTQLGEGGTILGTGPVSQDHGTVTLSGGTTLLTGSRFVVRNATIAGSGAFGGAGALVFSNSATFAGNLTIASGGTLHILSDNWVNLNWDSALTNFGTVLWEGNCDIRGSRQRLVNSGTFLARNLSGRFTDFDYYDYLPMQFLNLGVFRRDVAGTNVFDTDNQGVRFHNCGTLDVAAGVLGLNGGGSSTNGVFAPGPAGILQFAGLDHYLYPGSRFDVSGQLRLLAGSITQVGVTHTVKSGGVLEVAGGTFDGIGELGGPGTFVWSGGTLGGTNTLLANGTMNITGSATKYIARDSTLLNQGTIVWTLTGDIAGSRGSLIRNVGVFDAQNDQSLTDYDYYDYVGATFENLGTLRKSNSTNLTSFLADNQGFTLTNAGLVEARSGVISLRSGTRLGNGGSFTGAGVTRQDANTVTIFGTNTVLAGGRFQLWNATMAGIGSFGGAGSVVWTNQANLVGQLTILPAGTLDIMASDAVYLNHDSTLANAGTVIWRGAGEIRASRSVLRNTGTFLARSQGRVVDFDYYDYVPAEFINLGIVRKDVLSTNEFSGENQGIRFHNCGVLDAQLGELNFNGGGWSTNGLFSASAAGHIQFGGLAHYLTGSSRLDSAGAIRVVAGSVTQAGTTNITRSGGTIELAGGTLDGTGSTGGAGTMLWTGGTLGGTNRILADGTMRIAGASEKALGTDAMLSNDGTIIWADTGGIAGIGRAVLQNNQLFEARNDATIYDGHYYDYVGCTFINNGTFRKTGTTGTTRIAGDNQGFAWVNNGVLDAVTGTLRFESGLTLAKESLFKFTLNGRSPGTNYGVIRHTGTVPLDGRIELALGGGFVPQSGDSFPLVLYANFSGQLTGIQFPQTAPGLEWRSSISPTSITFDVQAGASFVGSVLGDKTFAISFSAPAASQAVVQASTNLVHWESLQTNAPFTGVGAFQEPMNRPARFYRLLITQ